MAYLLQEIEYAASIGDKTLVPLLKRLSYYETGKSENAPDGYASTHQYSLSEVRLRKDSYAKHSFYFEWYDHDGNLIMNGGILFHGNVGEPDNSGAVTLKREYGWTMHT